MLIIILIGPLKLTDIHLYDYNTHNSFTLKFWCLPNK